MKVVIILKYVSMQQATLDNVLHVCDLMILVGLDSIEIQGSEPFLNGNQTILHVETLGHVLHAFINGKLAGDDFNS